MSIYFNAERQEKYLDSMASVMERWLVSLVRLCSLHLRSMCLSAAALVAVPTLLPW